jgi:hypothetical protein
VAHLRIKDFVDISWRYCAAVILITGALIGGILGFGLISKDINKSSALTAAFPVNYVFGNRGGLRANDLESTWEYYLLEDLSLGLVRDDLREPSGYRGMLAESWHQLDDYSFEFKLREGIQWSDGSAMNCEQIRDSITHSLKTNSRHIFYLKDMENIECGKNSLVFKLKSSIGSEILGELSLADLTILNSRNLRGDWSVTSGFYSLQIVQKNYELVSSKAGNLEWPQNSPRTIHFVDPFSSSEAPDIFMKTAGIDVYPVMVGIYQEKYNKILESQMSKSGPAGLIHFFYFSRENTNDLRRMGLRKLISKAASSSKFPPRLIPFGQLIPPGYDGYLDKLGDLNGELTNSELRALRSSTIKIDFLRGQNFEVFKNQLRADCSDLGLKIEISVSDDTRGRIKDAELYSYMFKGNMKDSMSSWEFHFNSQNGNLKEYRDIFEKILAQSRSIPRQDRPAFVHESILKASLVIPFGIEQNIVFHSARTDLGRWNPYDLRMRFYEISILK